MSSLLNQLASSEGKTAYQTYFIQHGIEKIAVLIPLCEAAAFEKQFSSLTDTRKSTILEAVKALGGKVRA